MCNLFKVKMTYEIKVVGQYRSMKRRWWKPIFLSLNGGIVQPFSHAALLHLKIDIFVFLLGE
jgi:hypothetical protein